jgi:hypothetical protein
MLPQPRLGGPRGNYKRRWYFNKNHLIKGKDRTKRPAGHRQIRRRFQWIRNPGIRVLKRRARVDQHLKSVIGRQGGTSGRNVKWIWEYIKRNKLQHPADRRLVRPDKLLAAVVGSKGHYIDGSEMMKFLPN